MCAYLPIFLRLADKTCVVVGAGKVARRKAAELLGAGARVTLVAPDARWEDANVRVVRAPYDKAHLRGAFLVFAATDDRELNRRIARDASDCGAMANAVDDADGSDFILGASFVGGPLTAAFSTSGASPALAARMRDEAAGLFDDHYRVFAELLRELRTRVQAEVGEPARRHEILRLLAGERFLNLVRTQGREAALSAMREHLERELKEK